MQITSNAWYLCKGYFQQQKNAEIRHRILNKLENEPNITLQQIAEDCQWYVRVKQDSKKNEESVIALIRKIRYNKKQTESLTKMKESKQTKDPTKSNESKNEQKYLLPKLCSGCGALYWYTDCTFRNKKCSICHQIGHKSSHCRSKNKMICSIKNTKTDEPDDANTREIVHVKTLNKSVKFQLDSGSDLTITHLQTWEKLGRPTMIKSTKIVRSVTREKKN